MWIYFWEGFWVVLRFGWVYFRGRRERFGGGLVLVILVGVLVVLFGDYYEWFV